MTYPPGSPGYPPAQASGSYAAPAAPSFNKGDEGESNLKQYLTIGVLVLGLAIYLVSYGPMITSILPNGDELIESGSTLPVDLALLAGLLAGVSQKMLTQTLRSLERDGLVTRTATPTVPVTVSYELTDLGLSLHHVMRGIKVWAEAHMDEVLVHREEYDACSS